MQKFRIHIHPPLTDATDMQYLSEAMQSGYVAPDGPFNRLFEKKLKEFLQIPYVLTVQSGTAALHLALKNTGIQEGDYVLVPTHTFVASAEPVLYEKAIPVFIESEQDKPGLSPAYLEEAIRSLLKKNIRLRAIIAVHLYGLSAPMDAIMELANRYEIAVIEDAAESLGTQWKGQYTGTIAPQGILSFNGNKIITTSGGGALLSREEAFYRRAKHLAFHARKREYPHFMHDGAGYNYAMSNILAALGTGQLEKLETYIEKKRDIHMQYKKHGLELVEEQANERSNYWLNILRLPRGFSPRALMEYLAGKGIETRLPWYPLHLMPFYARFPYYGNGESKNWFDRHLLLPSGPGLTAAQVEEIVFEIGKFLSK